ncbi:tyrosine--tRNA ligase [Clostridium rectalis]|uniref:tyrosine--tRNA ligase n=1 Tax=Clostridium rectalis TaxID=2040295 RepID=UPI000F632B12|nr:tyrosine--tRNA ligase [Clostridium rectalis]
MKDVFEQVKIIKKGVDEIINEEELKSKIEKSIKENKPLKIKLGLDPSAPDIHLGHTVVLRKIRQMQDLGHEAILIIGDFTGMIGDPTGKSKARKPLTREQVLANAKTYTDQIFKVLREDKTQVRFNSEWLEKMNFKDVLELAGKYTVARMLEREDFKNRFQNNLSIGIHEFFYPLMQGFDSVTIKCDIELGGTDQRFNILMGRTLQKDYGMDLQIGLFMPLLEGLDGKEKMSKSLGNYIGISEDAESMFSKVMAIPDELIIKYYTLCTDIHPDVIKNIEDELKNGRNPRDIKLDLAFEITKLYNGEGGAIKGREYFKKVFTKREMPDEIEEVKVDLNEGSSIIDVLVVAKAVKSKSEVRRLIQGGGIKLNGEKVEMQTQVFNDNIIQVGKRIFVKIKMCNK